MSFKVHLKLTEHYEGKLQHTAICGSSSKELTTDPRAVTCRLCKRYNLFLERKLEVNTLNV